MSNRLGGINDIYTRAMAYEFYPTGARGAEFEGSSLQRDACSPLSRWLPSEACQRAAPLVDRDARVIVTTNETPRWFERYDYFTIANGRLVPRSASQHSVWLRAVADAASHQRARFLVLEPGSVDLPVVLMPHEELEGIFVIAGRRNAVCTAALEHYAAHFGLTRAERETLELIIEGFPAKKIATVRGTSEATTRSQIRSILVKCGFSSQISLALYLARLPTLQ